MEPRTPLLVLQLILLHLAQSIEVDSVEDLMEEESQMMPAEHRGEVLMRGEDEWRVPRPEVPRIRELNVRCEKNHMKVNVQFDRPFHGVIFSKGHYGDQRCVHLPPDTGHQIANFEIFLGSCGMSSSSQHGDTGTGFYIENTIIVQYDPQLQEVWDQARKLRCTWYDFYEKAVTFRPFNVDMLDAVTANFLGDNIQCWMQVQVGKGPWASEVSGIVKIGQTMTMLLAIKDEENRFDMLVRSCIAHDGKRPPLHLVDEHGCILRPKIMSRFQKIKNFGSSASVASYAYFQAFKFPDSMDVHFQCVIQVCRHECPEPKCGPDQGYMHGESIHPPPEMANSLPSGLDLPPGLELPPMMEISEDMELMGDQSHPLPRLPDSQSNYGPIFLNRKGEPLTMKGNNVHLASSYSITGGSPRRLKRQIGGDMKDIQTRKVIQVVAPGDVAFALPLEMNGSYVDVVEKTRYLGSSLCLSTPSFTVGMVIILLLLILASLVAVFLYMRVRQLTSGKQAPAEKIISYESPSYYTVPLPPLIK